MVDYTFDTGSRLINYTWTKDGNGTHTYKPIPWIQTRSLGIICLLISLFCYLFSRFVPDPVFQNVLLGACVVLPPIGILFGMIFDFIGYSKGPIISIGSDRTITLHRLNKIVKPDESTRFETRETHRTNKVIIHDLILFHRDQTYYIISCGGHYRRPAWGIIPKSDFEKLYDTLNELALNIIDRPKKNNV